MALQGDLKEFGIPEIFQLLDQQSKTGCLKIDTEIKVVEVYFREGKIAGAVSGGLNLWDHLLMILFNLGFLSEEEVLNLKNRQKKDLNSLTELLRQEGLLEPAKLNTLLREHTEELIFPIFQRRKGAFNFIQDKVLPADLELPEPLAPEPVIIEALRKSDEWPMLKKKIGPFHEIPQRQITLEGGASSFWKNKLPGLGKTTQTGDKTNDEWKEIDSLLEGEVTFPTIEKVIYALIDGKRTIFEIIQESAFGEYTACKALLSLLEDGRISLLDPKHVSSQAKKVSVSGRKDLFKGGIAFFGLLAIIFAVQFITKNPAQKSLVALPFIYEVPPVQQLFNQPRQDRVLRALELYMKEKGGYPEQLSDLVQARLLYKDQLMLLGANQFSYDPKPKDGRFLKIIPVE